VPLSKILSDLWPRFQGHDIFEVEYLKNGASWGLQHTNRKPYLNYGMVPCLVTMTNV